MTLTARMTTLFCEIIVLLFAFVPTSHAEGQESLELKEAAFFGGSGDQGTSQLRELGMAIQGGHLYLAGVDKALYGGQALAASYTLPFGTSPVWSFRWPNQRGRGWWNDEVFTDVVATAGGLYVSGWSMSQTSDGVGDKEHKAVLVKFPLSGSTGPDVGGALWVAKPNFFRYRGIEGFFAVTAAEEEGSTFLYAAGHAQSNGVNNTAILAKYDVNGTLLWSRILGNTGWFMNSYVWTVTAHNGSIYVTGDTNYPYTLNNLQATLWKYDPSGNQIWMKTFNKVLALTVYRAVDLIASHGSLYLATALKDGPHGGAADVLLLKYDEQGTLIWSKTWGGPKDDSALGIAAEADGGRLYVVGETASFGSGKKDAFLLEVDPADGAVLSSTYYGGAEDDVARRVRVLGEDLYVAGESKSFANGGNAIGQSDVMLLHYRLKPREMAVSIDIKPEGIPNSINPKSHGKIPVAILSTLRFRAPDSVKQATLTFGRLGSEQSLSFCKPEDVNGDGLLDLVCHFETQKASFQAEDTQGVLRGLTTSETPLRGTDSIRIVPGTQ
ncbi:MAG: hypothetical protein Q8R91_02515 [Candidatus Omnitrophota bacterium]|nr:hypothetical protein [Candidatus Omnitrophota bacterium]